MVKETLTCERPENPNSFNCTPKGYVVPDFSNKPFSVVCDYNYSVSGDGKIKKQMIDTNLGLVGSVMAAIEAWR